MKKLIMIVALGASVITAPAFAATPAAAAQDAHRTQVAHSSAHCVPGGDRGDPGWSSAFPNWEVC